MSGGLVQPVLERRVYLNESELRFLLRVVSSRIATIGRKCSDDDTRFVIEPFTDRITNKLERALRPRRKERT
jgi:hypothetical protein